MKCRLFLSRAIKVKSFAKSSFFLLHSLSSLSMDVRSGIDPSTQKPARSITADHNVTSFPAASIHSAGLP